MSDYTVHVNGPYSRVKWGGGRTRESWGYAVSSSTRGHYTFVSQYRWGSAEAARKAGERDVAELLAWEAKEAADG